MHRAHPSPDARFRNTKNMAMKYVLSVLLLLSTAWLPVEVAVVTFVRGIITNTRTNMKLRIGDRVFSTDRLLFTAGASLSCRMPGKGAFVMDARGIKPEAGGKLLASVSEAQAATKFNLAGKKGGTFATPQEVIDYFSAGGTPDAPKPLLVLGQARYAIASAEFPQGESTGFFFISYDYPTEAGPVLKKLAYEGQELLLDEGLFSINGTPIDPEQVGRMQLFFLKVAQPKSQKIYLTDVKPVFASEADVAEQAKAVAEALGEGATAQEILDAVLDHLANVYGLPDNHDVKALLSRELGLAFD
jgi:hypothetical protein